MGDIEKLVAQMAQNRLPLAEVRTQVERCFLRRALAAFGGNLIHTARSIGISRGSLERKIVGYHLFAEVQAGTPLQTGKTQ